VINENSTDEYGNSTINGTDTLARLKARMQEPTTLFDSLYVVSLPGLIEWVERGDTYTVEEFIDKPIMQRANMKKDRDDQVSVAANNPDALTPLTQPMAHFDTSGKHPTPAGKRLAPHFGALSAHLRSMAVFVRESHKRITTRPHSRHTKNSGFPLSEEEYDLRFKQPERKVLAAAPEGEGPFAATAAAAAAEIMQKAQKSLISSDTLYSNATQVETADRRRELAKREKRDKYYKDRTSFREQFANAAKKEVSMHVLY
jgi:hypothetical protein